MLIKILKRVMIMSVKRLSMHGNVVIKIGGMFGKLYMLNATLLKSFVRVQYIHSVF